MTEEREEVRMLPDGASLLPPYERLLHEAPAIIYVYDLIEARSLYQNREIGDLLGYRGGAEKRPDWRELMHPEDAARFPAHRERLRRLQPGESALFEYRLRDVRGEWHWMMSRDVPLSFSPAGQVTQVLGTATDATERRRSEEQQQLLARELNHRVKNLLSIVTAIIVRTHRTQSVDDFLPSVTARLRALATAADLLVDTEWTNVPVGELVERMLDSLPHLSGRITVEGPPVELAAGQSLTLGLVLHELATNAMKYGALGSAGGVVRLDWLEKDRAVRFSWVEEGGPPVTAPGRKGFGSQLIERTMADSRGEFDVNYAPTGLRCRFLLPLA